MAAWVVPAASAQTELRSIIGPLELSEFPKITTYLDVRGPQGYFVPGLLSDAVTVYEDERALAATITEVRTGAQAVFAFGGGDSFNIRTVEGAVSRFQLVRNWLVEWASNAESGLDDLGLVVPQGVLASHASDPQVWLEALQGYTLETSGGTSLEALSAAIDIALEATPREGMGRSVVFLSDILVDSQLDVFQSLIDRAEQGGVRVNIGLISFEGLFASDMAQVMQAGAQQTGGQFFTFSSAEQLPDLNMLLESSRRVYLLEYRSAVSSAGAHTMYVVVTTELGDVRSQTVSYESALLPPVPVFFSPPNQIVRSVPDGEDEDLLNLSPSEIELSVLVEFQDSIRREIVGSRLYVNGELAVENEEAPFDTFNLDLTPFQTSEMLLVRAEVTDELGMSGTSVDISIELVVQQPKGGLFSAWSRNASLIAAGVVVLSGSVLLLVLVLAGRLRPRQIGQRRRKRQAELDPVTQPVDLENQTTQPRPQTEPPRAARRFPARLPWQQRPRTTPFAYLVQVDDDNQIKEETEFPITSSELTFGSDPAASVLTLKDPAVEPAHARIWRDDKGIFWIADLGSVAGTWLNYAPVSGSGSKLEHGDLVHVAKTGFRFTLSRPTRPRRTVITPLDPSPDSKKGDR
jgi:hypothetical protein